MGIDINKSDFLTGYNFARLEILSLMKLLQLTSLIN